MASANSDKIDLINDGPCSDLTSTFMLAKSATFIKGDFLMADLKNKSDSMHSNVD